MKEYDMNSTATMRWFLTGFVLFILNVVKTDCQFTATLNGYEYILPLKPSTSSSTPSSFSSSSSLSRLLEKNFPEAAQWCREYKAGSMLVEIKDKDFQRYISAFLQKAVHDNILNSTFKVRLGGIFRPSEKWIWVNGGNGPQINSRSKTFFCGKLELELNSYSFQSGHSENSNNYLCEYKDDSLRVDCNFRRNGRCFVAKRKVRRWYQARNDCLNGEGDLASLDFFKDQQFNETIQQLRGNSSKKEYWVGLRKGQWLWNSTGSEMRLTNWMDGFPTGEGSSQDICLCLNRGYFQEPQLDWTWVICECKATHPFICFRRTDEQSSKNGISTQNCTDKQFSKNGISAENSSVRTALMVSMIMLLVIMMLVMILH